MNRRGFLKALGIGASVSAVMPATAYSKKPVKNRRVVEPILLERVCDGGKEEMPAEEYERMKRKGLNLGCGTRFRWYFGSMAICPNCGRTHLYTMKQLKAEQYVVNKEALG